jgi:FkbM family methyltransferase
MTNPEIIIKKLIFKTFSFTMYLRIVSRFYFLLYNTGFLRNNVRYKYHYFLKNLINTNDVVIDIGANLGYYTIPFAKWVGPGGFVYAVEPVRQVRVVLKNHIGKRRNIKLLPYALGSENKNIRMGNNTIAEKGIIATGSHFVLEKDDTALNEFSAEMKRGSELFKNLEKLDLIKCDVEGYETVIIPEMESILTKHKPTMLIETKNEKRVFLLNYLLERGFKGYILENKKLIPADNSEEKTEDDIIFIHNSNITLLNKFIE